MKTTSTSNQPHNRDPTDDYVLLLLSSASKLPSTNASPDILHELAVHQAKAEYARHIRRHTQMQLDRAIRVREERYARLHGGLRLMPRRHNPRKVDAC